MWVLGIENESSRKQQVPLTTEHLPGSQLHQKANMWVLGEARRGSLGAGVTGGCEPPGVGTGTWT